MINIADHKPKNLIVFTDLDGTLLDHNNYSYDGALPALHFLRKNGIPLILASSKTAAEIIKLRKELGFQHCEAIVENGAGILEPEVDYISDTTTHQKLIAVLDTLPTELRSCFQGFSDWSVQDVMEKTGLSEDGAALAKQRQFSEPGLWSGSDSQYIAFLNALEAKGASIQQGGRFTTLSFGDDKADAVQAIKVRYAETGTVLYSIALGDAPNDIAMLKSADFGIIIPNPSHENILAHTDLANSNIVRAERSGPVGWGESLLNVLNDIIEKDKE